MEWIKLSEQLPEVGEMALLVDVNEGLVYIGHIRPNKRDFITNNWNVGENYFTHWMPFPKPPKGEQNVYG